MDVIPRVNIKQQTVSGTTQYSLGFVNPYYGFNNEDEEDFPYYVRVEWGDKAVFSDRRENVNGDPYILFSIQDAELDYGARSHYSNLDKVNLYFYTKPGIHPKTGEKVYVLGIKKYLKGASKFELDLHSYSTRQILSESAFHNAVSFLENLVDHTVRTLKRNAKTKQLSDLPKNIQNKMGEYLVGRRFKPEAGFKYGLNHIFKKKGGKQTRKNRRTNGKTRRSNK